MTTRQAMACKEDRDPCEIHLTSSFMPGDKPDCARRPIDSVSSAPTFYFGSSSAGKSVSVKSAIQMSTVYACVRVIARNHCQPSAGCV